MLRVLSVYLKASLNNPNALAQIGDMYLAGRDVPKNGIRAWAWFTLASQNGAAGAHAKVAEAKAIMTADESNEARQLLPKLIEELGKVASALHGAPERIESR